MYDKGNKKIFVAIAAYNEIDLIQTINSCLDNAKNPERINFGIWAHYNKVKFPDLNIPNVKYIMCNYPGLLGVGSARLNAISLYAGEDYYLQLDAHMLFEKDWDLKLLDHYHVIKNEYSNPLISTYTPWWSRNENGSVNFYDPESTVVNGAMRYKLDDISEGYPKQEVFPVDWSKHEYYEHSGISAAFIFSSSSFIEDVMPDPSFAFGGEEPTISLRAWSSGYRIFTIKHPIVWHKNKLHGVNHKYDRLNYPGDVKYADQYFKKHRLGAKRSIDILTGKILGYWGASSLDVLQEYHNFVGTDFSNFTNIDERNEHSV
jgi:hypothetical protein